jgi:hypothetical protein
MTPHEYLSGVLIRETMAPQQITVLQGLRSTIEAGLRQQFGSAPRFYYGGSYGKGTMLRSAYDLDIVMYFPSSERATLAQLFGAVHQQLLALRYVVRPRTVALRLPYEGGFHIDLVPGRAQDASFRYATLHKNISPPGTLQTSLKVHIDAVTKSGIANIVRLVKLWRLQQGLDFPTFALEIAIARALYGLQKGDLGVATTTVFRFLATNATTMRFEDPANTNNEVEVVAGQRKAIAAAAPRAIEAVNWGGIIV